MSDVPGVSPDRDFRGPHGIGDEWISFELRMRRRKAAKCLLRADLAIDDGHFDEARDALEEARELSPDSSDISPLEERLEASVAAAIARQPADAQAQRALRVRPATIAYAAGFLLIAGGAIALGLPYWNRGESPPQAAAVQPPSSPAVTPISHAETTLKNSVASNTAHRLEVVYETVRVKEATPRIVEDAPHLEPSPSRAIADAEPEPERAPVVLAVNRTPAPPPAIPPSPEVRTGMAVGAPAVTLAAPPPPPEPERREPEAREPAPPEPEPVLPDESAVVRAVLQRYERAYSSLDAVEASALQPRVNKGDLKRAFEGLASQSVSLGSCQLDINGPAAHAICSGSATWEPKVGGGVRTEARRWNFELRKSGGGWQIERAIAR